VAYFKHTTAGEFNQEILVHATINGAVWRREEITGSIDTPGKVSIAVDSNG
jgi:hypothetical protein